jgi:hypothetical protein
VRLDFFLPNSRSRALGEYYPAMSKFEVLTREARNARKEQFKVPIA